MTAKILTQAILKEVLHYDPLTGIFTWRERALYWFKAPCWQQAWNTKNAGNHAGTKKSDGYIEFRVLGRTYKAHRLAWLYMKDEWPLHIDHRNHVRHDNRIDNLRSGTCQENQLNKARYKHNKSGRAGVFWRPDMEKWTAAINHKKKRIHLGSFTNFEDACQARSVAERQLGFHENHGALPI